MGKEKNTPSTGMAPLITAASKARANHPDDPDLSELSTSLV